MCVCVLLCDVQSVNKGTSNRTLSMFSRCGFTFSIPFGSLAWKNKNQVISILGSYPGSKKENSFLEGLNNDFIEFWSVNIVLMSGTLFSSSMRHAPSCSIALDSALSLTLSLSRISSSEINKCKFKRIKRMHNSVSQLPRSLAPPRYLGREGSSLIGGRCDSSIPSPVPFSQQTPTHAVI